MNEIIRTNSSNEDFVKLVKLLDADLAIRDGEDHAFYDQFNKIDAIKHVMVLFVNGSPASCGAIKVYDEHTMEIKRMFTCPEFRGNGFASKILSALEEWAQELKFKKCILETGVRQPEAIGLYRKNNYQVIPNYGQYINMKNSVCFEKSL